MRFGSLQKFGLLLSFMLFISGCGKPTINGENEEAFKQSLESMKDNLGDEKTAKLDSAIMTIGLSKIDFGAILEKSSEDQEVENVSGKEIWKTLDGKTASEIITLAKKVELKSEIETKKETHSEWQSLQEKKQKARERRKELKQFKVLSSRYYVKDKRFGMDQPVIKLTIKNKTEYPIARAYFKGTIKSPDRSVPWLEEEFNHSISGGVEPGEEVVWELAPNPLGEWGDLDLPADASLKVQTIKLDGPDDETVLDGSGLSDYENNRLEDLKTKYGSLSKLEDEIERQKEELKKFKS